MTSQAPCTECYRRKKKCNRQEPCSNCSRRYPLVDCIYTQRSSRSEPATSAVAEQSLALPLRTDGPKSALRRPHKSYVLVAIESCNVNRAQLIALNEDFLSIDSMFGMNHGLPNDQTLYHCLCQLTNKNSTLDVAIQALCLVQLSIRYKDGRLKVESMLMNGKALKMLHRALRNASTAYSIETIAASLCLKTYEELACSSGSTTGINQLIKGSRILVKQRGPSCYAHTIDHVIFARWFREYDVYHALAQEVSTFLAAQEWCTMPWAGIPKNDSDHLVDIIAAYANVRDQVKFLEDAGFSLEELKYAESILKSVIKLSEQLSMWFEDFEKSIPGPMFSTIPWTTDSESQGIFCFRFQFINLKIAMMHLKYWSTCILIHGSMIRIEKYFERADASPNTTGKLVSELRPGFDFQKMIDCAMNICRSLDYALDHTMKSSGPIYLTYPILVVHKFFQSWVLDKRLCRWSQNKLRELQSSGYEFVSQYDAHNIRGKDERKDSPKHNFVVPPR